MKKFFCSTHNLFLLLIVSTILNATATTGEITLTVYVYDKKEVDEEDYKTYDDKLELNATAEKELKVSVDLTNDKHYFDQLLKVLEEQFPDHHFLFTWGFDENTFKLRDLATSSFPITKECSERIVIDAVKKDLLDEGVTVDPVKIFKNRNSDEDLDESEIASVAESTVSSEDVPFTTGHGITRTRGIRAESVTEPLDTNTEIGNRAETDSHTSSTTSSETGKKGGALLKYGGALLLVSILAGVAMRSIDLLPLKKNEDQRKKRNRKKKQLSLFRGLKPYLLFWCG